MTSQDHGGPPFSSPDSPIASRSLLEHSEEGAVSDKLARDWDGDFYNTTSVDYTDENWPDFLGEPSPQVSYVCLQVIR
jgi:hypothetical protein